MALTSVIFIVSETCHLGPISTGLSPFETSILQISIQDLSNPKPYSGSYSQCLYFSCTYSRVIMANVAVPVPPNREDEEDPHPAAEDEDTGAPVAPIVRLEEVSVVTGEENEEILLNLKAKLYRFDKEGNQWKERGVGTVKVLKDKVNGRVRLVMRQNKTLKICANHLVLPTFSVQEHHGNDKSCVWHAADFADGELKDETFCIRFPSVENCKAFKDKIEEITESVAQVGGESEEANTAASLLENLSVGGKYSEEKPNAKEETPSSVGGK